MRAENCEKHDAFSCAENMCTRHLRETSGVITSPAGPEVYPNRWRCLWLLETSVGHNLRLEVSEPFWGAPPPHSRNVMLFQENRLALLRDVRQRRTAVAETELSMLATNHVTAEWTVLSSSETVDNYVSRMCPLLPHSSIKACEADRTKHCLVKVRVGYNFSDLVSS